ncbi:MAG: hypothetical protein U5J63_12945 [Fodinibius sp.]|nr:hypothetical protein [Fodinibius sp.]
MREKAFVAQTSGILAAMGVVAGLVILGVAYFAPTMLSTWDPANIQKVQDLLPLMALVTVLEVPDPGRSPMRRRPPIARKIRLGTKCSRVCLLSAV